MIASENMSVAIDNGFLFHANVGLYGFEIKVKCLTPVRVHSLGNKPYSDTEFANRV